MISTDCIGEEARHRKVRELAEVYKLARGKAQSGRPVTWPQSLPSEHPLPALASATFLLKDFSICLNISVTEQDFIAQGESFRD